MSSEEELNEKKKEFDNKTKAWTDKFYKEISDKAQKGVKLQDWEKKIVDE